MRWPAFLLVAVLLVGGCESPPPMDVMELLPLPPGAVVRGAGCVGKPRTQGFTCVVHANSKLSMEDGAAEAARTMHAWKEYSWDWVPGRIQSSWSRENEDVALSIHDIAGSTQWSLTYIWGEFPDSIPENPYPAHAADPAARIPETLASIPVPPNAELLGSSSTPPGPHAEAFFAVEGEPLAILKTYESMPGWTKSLQARAPWTHAVGWRRDGVEIVANLWLASDGKHTLMLRALPAL